MSQPAAHVTAGCTALQNLKIFISKNKKLMATSLFTLYCCLLIGRSEILRQTPLSHLKVHAINCVQRNDSVHLYIVSRLQAVTFWIVERSCKIAECKKTGVNEWRGAK